jgi:hypothetical protein
MLHPCRAHDDRAHLLIYGFVAAFIAIAALGHLLLYQVTGAAPLARRV